MTRNQRPATEPVFILKQGLRQDSASLLYGLAVMMTSRMLTSILGNTTTSRGGMPQIFSKNLLQG
jgi:hypothetical protein